MYQNKENGKQKSIACDFLWTASPVDIWYPNIPTPTAPILIFGHCLFGPPDYYDYLYKTLVPKGYIVALPIGDRFSGRETELCADMRTTLDWIYDNCTVSKTCPFRNTIGSAVCCTADSYVGQKFNHTFDAGMTLSVCGQTAANGQSTFDDAKNLTKQMQNDIPIKNDKTVHFIEQQYSNHKPV